MGKSPSRTFFHAHVLIKPQRRIVAVYVQFHPAWSGMQLLDGRYRLSEQLFSQAVLLEIGST